MQDTLKFLKAGLKNPLHIGAIAPSSPALATAMVKDISPKEDESILELGVGTGPFTAFIDQILMDKRNFMGIEHEVTFFKTLHERFPHLNLIHGDAADAFQLYEAAKMDRVRYILSGLPFASLPTTVRMSILSTVDQFMEHGCLFRTFQYVHAYRLPPAKAFRAYMTERYGEVERSAVVWKNLPPAYTLTWQS